MIEAATVDAYGEDEQATGWFTVIGDNLEVPFETEVLCSSGAHTWRGDGRTGRAPEVRAPHAVPDVRARRGGSA